MNVSKFFAKALKGLYVLILLTIGLAASAAFLLITLSIYSYIDKQDKELVTISIRHSAGLEHITIHDAYYNNSWIAAGRYTTNRTLERLNPGLEVSFESWVKERPQEANFKLIYSYQGGKKLLNCDLQLLNHEKFNHKYFPTISFHNGQVHIHPKDAGQCKVTQTKH